jgi:hypothetical protein
MRIIEGDKNLLSACGLMAVMVVCLLLIGCASPVTIANPCGVITDSLKDVQGKTDQDTRRIDGHFERGGPRGAKCWGIE